jgi:hypothetical protein
MKLEILVARLQILVIVLLATMIAGGLYFLSQIPTAVDNGETVLCTVLSLGGGIFGAFYSIVKGIFKPIEA